MAVAACSAFSQMAFIAPNLVLPLVQTRFQVHCQSDINPNLCCTNAQTAKYGSYGGPHRVPTRLLALTSITLLLDASADQAAEPWLVEGNKHSVFSSNGIVKITTVVSWGWGQVMQNWVLRQVTLLQVALESVSATHQLVSAIHTFAICVRPLLLTGFAPNPDSAESGPVDAAEHKVHVLWTSVLGS